MGAEESGWSERRTRALFKYIFRIELGPERASSGFLVTSENRAVRRVNCRVGGQYLGAQCLGCAVCGAQSRRCAVSRELVRIAENWLADPQKQQPTPPETAAC